MWKRLLPATKIIAGYLMLQAGRKKLEPSALKPAQTQESLRRDADVLGRRNP